MYETADIIKRLADIQKSSGLSYAALEKKTGIAHSTIQRYLTGASKKVPFTDIIKICQALGADPAEVLGWTGNAEMRSPSSERAALISLVESVPDDQIPLLYKVIQVFLANK